MSVASQCSDCCTCPTATVQWDSVSASLTKCGYTEFSTPSSPPKYYLSSTADGTAGDIPASTWNSAKTTFSNNCGTITRTGTITDADASTCNYSGSLAYWRPDIFDTDTCNGASRDRYTQDVLQHCPNDFELTFVYVSSDTSTTVRVWGTCGSSNTLTETLSDEYTTALLKSNTVAALPAYDNDWNDTAGSFANLSTDELSYSIRESRYRIRFKIPQVRTAKCYRLSWVEQFIPEAGTSISSVEVYSPGVYRPTVTISGGNGTGAIAIAVMSSTGTVSSIRILNPGSGYTSAPIVTVQTAINSGTTATGWTATLTDDQVTSISGGSGGDYRPTLTFSAPPSPGTTATGTCTVDERGGIDAVSVTASGSGYTSAPALTITSKVSGTTAADLLLHLGTETTKCATWDGTTPGGYDPATPSTYPILGDGTNPYFSLAVPTSDGITLVANVRAVCDCSSCS